MKKGFFVTVLLLTIVVVFASFVPLLEQAAPAAENTTQPVGSNPVTSGTVAEAKLWPKQDASLGFPSSGILAEINVAAGADVKKGDVLAVLEGTEQFQLAYSNATLELLQAEKDLKSLQDSYAKLKADANLAVIEAKSQLDDMQKAFEQYELPAYRKKLDDANKAARDKHKDLDDAQELVDDVSDLAADSERRIAIEDDYTKVRQDYDALKRAYNLLVNDKDLAEANVKNAQAALDDAARELDELAEGPKQADLDILNQRISTAKDAQTNAAKNIELMKIIAPFDGQVVSVDGTVGELIPVGSQVMVLADPTALVLKTVDLSETNMNKVKLGNSVKVTFDAFPGREFQGTVTKVTNWSEKYLGDVVFPVEITLEPTNVQLLWGMTASVYFD